SSIKNTSVTITDTGALTVTGLGAAVNLLSSALTLYCPTDWQNAIRCRFDIDLNAIVINNYGTFTTSNAQSIVDLNVASPSAFMNLDDGQGHRGTFVKAGGGGATAIKVAFTNSGDIYFINGFGTLTFTLSYTQTANGTLKINVGGPNQAQP